MKVIRIEVSCSTDIRPTGDGKFEVLDHGVVEKAFDSADDARQYVLESLLEEGVPDGIMAEIAFKIMEHGIQQSAREKA